jgi:PAS domain-containing protein
MRGHSRAREHFVRDVLPSSSSHACPTNWRVRCGRCYSPTPAEEAAVVAVDNFELQLLAAVQRYQALQRRVETRPKDPSAAGAHAVAQLGTALELVRVVHDQLVECRHRSEALVAELAAQRAKYWALFDEIAEPVLVTSADTTILEANRAAAELLNVSQRFLVGKTLSVFVCQDRGPFLAASNRLAQEGDSAELGVKLRPRERAPLALTAKVRGEGATLRWTLRPPSRIGAPAAHDSDRLRF